MGQPAIYLDYNATTPLRPGVWEAMRPVAELLGNPSSSHRAGRQARRYLEDARDQVAGLLGADPDEVIFTSGATEANNLALFGLAGLFTKDGQPFQILASKIEHPCVVGPLERLAERTARVDWLPAEQTGQVEVRQFIEHLTDSTRLAVLMLANHETGTIQPIDSLRQQLPARVVLHSDAAQAVGKLPVHFHNLKLGTLSASAHKFGGPKGVGLLLKHRDLTLTPLFVGGHQERGQRPGTESAALAVGLSYALNQAVAEMDAERQTLSRLKADFWKLLQEQAGPVRLNGLPVNDPMALPTTLNVSFPGCRSDLLLMSLDLEGVACSTGSACSSGSLLPSPVLLTMGLDGATVSSSLRFSFGPSLTSGEVEEAARRIGIKVSQLRQSEQRSQPAFSL